MDNINLCSYGCGREARFQLKNGKWCCEPSCNSCPKKKQKNHDHMVKEWSNPESYYGSEKWKLSNSEGIKKVWENVNSVYNTDEYKEKHKLKTREACKDLLHRQRKSMKQKDRLKTMLDEERKTYFNRIAEGQKKPETRLKRSNTMKRLHNIEESVYNIEWKERIGKSLRLLWKDDKYRSWRSIKIRDVYKKRPEIREKQRESAKKNFRNPSFLEKWRQRRKEKPNKPETFLIWFIDSILPGKYLYVGDYKVWIGGKNPDFVNERDKKIIEHFGSWYHGQNFTGVPNEDHEMERINHFRKYGYETLVIWEHELQFIDTLEKKITEFQFVGGKQCQG